MSTLRFDQKTKPPRTARARRATTMIAPWGVELVLLSLLGLRAESIRAAAGLGACAAGLWA